jgi:hypothetical protein
MMIPLLFLALFGAVSVAYADCANTPNLGICLRTDGSLYTRTDYNDFINKVDATMGTDAASHDHSGVAGKGPKLPDSSLISSYSGVGACPENQFEIADNRNAAPTCAQPSFSNLSGVASDAQIPDSITRDNEVPASGTTQSANTVFAGPSTGAPAAPTFRTLTDADIPDNITASNYVIKSGDTMTGTLNLPANGLVAGTGQLVLSGGNVGIGIATPTVAKLVVQSPSPQAQFIDSNTGAHLLIKSEETTPGVRPTIFAISNDGTAATDVLYLYANALRVPDGKYAQLEDNNAGAPPAADCDADAERGRISLDTTNNRLYICMGATRGWDYVALTN